MASMDEFAAVTRRILEADGPEEYLPTVLYPARPEVIVLEGMPDVPDRKQLAIEWAASNGSEGEDFMIALLAGADAFVVVSRAGGTFSEREFGFGASAA